MLSAIVRRAARLRWVRAASMAAAFLVAGRTAAAQTPPTATLRFLEGGALAFTSPYGPADVGRLRGTFLSLPGQPTVDLFCVDILHYVTYDPNGWSVYLTNLGGTPSVDYTRQGARYADGTPDALTRYRKAAWLIDQYATARTLTDTAGIQGAMWLQFEPTLAPFDFANPGEALAVNRWLTASDAFAASAAFATYDWSRFTVATDVASAGVGNDYHGLQELIFRTPLTTTTPEPATVALVGIGLAAVGAAARRRRGAVRA